MNENPYIVLSNLHGAGVVPSRRFASKDSALDYVRGAVERLLSHSPSDTELRSSIWANVAMSVCREQEGTEIHKGVARLSVDEGGKVSLLSPDGATLHEWEALPAGAR